MGQRHIYYAGTVSHYWQWLQVYGHPAYQISVYVPLDAGSYNWDLWAQLPFDAIADSPDGSGFYLYDVLGIQTKFWHSSRLGTYDYDRGVLPDYG
jgi:hypothetical protein